jgi:hypothetical protein
MKRFEGVPWKRFKKNVWTPFQGDEKLAWRVVSGHGQ